MSQSPKRRPGDESGGLRRALQTHAACVATLRQRLAARVGAFSGLIAGVILGTPWGMTEEIVAGLTLALLGWLCGRTNSTFRRGTALASALAPQLMHRVAHEPQRRQRA